MNEAPRGTIEQVPVADLVPSPENYRHHPEDQVLRLVDSLTRFGQRKAVVVQASTRRIVAGHGVVLAAQSLGWDSVRCDVWDCTDSEAREYLIEDNESTWGAEDDREALAELLASVEERPPSFPPDRVEDLLRSVTYPRMSAEPEPVPALTGGPKVCPACGYEL